MISVRRRKQARLSEDALHLTCFFGSGLHAIGPLAVSSLDSTVVLVWGDLAIFMGKISATVIMQAT